MSDSVHVPEFNSRMPFMPFNWAQHSARLCRLTFAERGMFDAVRAELWSVVGCRMPRDMLVQRLRVGKGAKDAALLDSLLGQGLLKLDADGAVFDEVQVYEFAEAVRKGNEARENGRKGGRPPKATPSATAAPRPTPAPAQAPSADAEF